MFTTERGADLYRGDYYGNTVTHHTLTPAPPPHTHTRADTHTHTRTHTHTHQFLPVTVPPQRSHILLPAVARGGLLVGAKSEATVDVGRSMAPRAFGDSSRSDARGFPGKEAGRFSETGWKVAIRTRAEGGTG